MPCGPPNRPPPARLPTPPPASSASRGWRWQARCAALPLPRARGRFAPRGRRARRGPAPRGARQVAGHNQVGIRAASSYLRPFAERIDAARPHVADIAAQPQVTETAERLHGVVAVPHGRRADIMRVDQHLLRRRVNRAFIKTHRLSMYSYDTLRPSQPATILWGGPPGPRSAPWSTCSNAGRAGPGGPARTRASAPRLVAALLPCGT